MVLLLLWLLKVIRALKVQHDGARDHSAPVPKKKQWGKVFPGGFWGFSFLPRGVYFLYPGPGATRKFKLWKQNHFSKQSLQI